MRIKNLIMILLILALGFGGFIVTEYFEGNSIAWAETDESEDAELLYILKEEPGGIRHLSASMFIFTDVEMNKKIEWFFTPMEERVLAVMTLEQKIGQLFIVRPESLYGTTQVTSAMRDAIIERQPGGIIMFSENITSPEQIKSFNNELKSVAAGYEPIPMIIAVDEEGGMVARIANNWAFDVKRYDSMLDIGSTGDESQAEEVGSTIGSYLAEYGFDLDFAPVADCFTNPNNRVIGDRAFGADPDLVSDMVKACIEGFHSQGIMTAIKHYPGHGDTDSDTHTGAAVTSRNWEELKARELIPFVDNFSNTDMIMTSHIISRGVTGGDEPATISKVMIQEKLRGELGYDGVVVTDSMEMGAISAYFEPDEAAIRAIEAGCDIVLCPGDFEAAYDGIMEAVKSGRISEERIDESVLRIIRMKLKYTDSIEEEA